MHDYLIRVRSTGAETWTAELFAGGEPAPGQERIAGGGQFTRADLEADDLTTKAVLTAIRESDGDDPVLLKAGVRLFEMLGQAGVIKEWLKIRAKARTYLLIEDSKAEGELKLASWPWELLAENVDQDTFDCYFSMRASPVVRRHRKWGQLERISETLRIVLIAGEENLDPGNNLKASDELHEIQRIFQASKWSVLVHKIFCPPDADKIEADLNIWCPHIVHFVGHGSRTKTDDSLRLGAQHWPSQRIYQYFSKLNCKPRLFFVNACHSGQVDVARAVATITDKLLLAGVPAVIGSQAALRVDNAKSFATTFYRHFVQNENNDPVSSEGRLDVAAAAARDKVMRETGLNQRHWSLPVLTLASASDHLLTSTRYKEEITRCIVLSEVSKRNGSFVNRTNERRQLLDAFKPFAGNPVKRGYIIKGSGNTGKSWLVKRTLRDLAQMGFYVRYSYLSDLSPAPKSTRNVLDVLSDWRGIDKDDSMVRRTMENVDFQEFDRRLALAAVADREEIGTVFKAFLDAVKPVAAKTPVLLVLDQFREERKPHVDPVDFKDLMDLLIRPIHDEEPEVAGLYCLLIVRERDYADYLLSPLFNFDCLDLKEFSKEKLDDLLTEFFEFGDPDVAASVKTFLVKQFKLQENWSPTMLKRFEI